jgi:hypothetical protein
MGRDRGDEMTDVEEIRGDAYALRSRETAVTRDEVLSRKAEELAVFRDAGTLTEAELQEQMARFRWRLP